MPIDSARPSVTSPSMNAAMSAVRGPSVRCAEAGPQRRTLCLVCEVAALHSGTEQVVRPHGAGVSTYADGAATGAIAWSGF